MRRALCVLLALSMLVLLVGCTDSAGISYAELIPDPEVYFDGSDISVIYDGSETMYMCQVRNYQDGDYEVYVEECKTAGFTDIIYEMELDSGKMFAANSENGEYRADVSIAYDTEIITVTCQSNAEDE
ncbi:MAG: hypothetical protein LUH03_05280 [Oscillospiraceae bacterium]|nr:hypothetical protein [Oscillospiraceae bacterium]